jgi:hypothetical protein
MESIATISFSDVESGDEALVLLRAEEGKLALGLSLRKNGDFEVFLGPKECDKLMAALQRGIALVKGKPPNGGT